MALNSNELYTARTTVPREVRLEPSAENGTVKGQRLAAISGGKTLSKGHPLAYNTSTNLWVAFDGDGINGTNTIRGFLYTGLDVPASGETLVDVMHAGQLHFDELVDLLGGSDFGDNSEIDCTLAELTADLQANARSRRFNIHGLVDVR